MPLPKKPMPELPDETPVFRYIAIKKSSKLAFRWSTGFTVHDPRAGSVLTPTEVNLLRFMFDEDDVKFVPYSLLTTPSNLVVNE